MCAASSSTASANRSSSSSEVKKPTLIRTASRLGIVRAMAKIRDAELVERGLGRPAGDPERDQRAPSGRRGQDRRRPGSPASRAAAARGHRRPAAMDEVEPDVHRQPADRAGHPDDRRPVVAGGLEPPGVGPPDGVAGAVRALEAVPAAEGRGQPVDRRPVRPTSAPIPSGPSSHFWAGTAYRSAPELVEPDRDRAGGLRAVDHDERAARVGQLGDPGDGQDRAGRPQDVRDRDEPGVGRDRRVEGGERPLVVAVVAGVDERDARRRIRSRSAYSGPSAAGMLVGASSPRARRRASRAAASRRSSRRSWRGSARPRRRRCRGPPRRRPAPRPCAPASRRSTSAWARPTSRS